MTAGADGPVAAALGLAAPVALFEADAAMVIASANPWMARLTGLAEAEVVGRPLRDLLTRASQFVYAVKAEPSLLAEGRADEVFLELAHPSGRPTPILLTVAPGVGEAADRRYGAMFAAPERRAYELELIAARKSALAAAEARARFLASVSHELRTPLNGILAVACLVEAEAGRAEDRDRASLIVGSARELERRVDAILDFADLEDGAATLAETPTDLAAMMEAACEAPRAAAAAKGLAFRLEVAAGAQGRFLADAPRLRQIVRALADNAVAFTAEGEVAVALDCDAAAGEVVLSVSDTGPGFDPADAERLWSPFERGAEAGARGGGGLGLGLATVKRLAGLMGGRVGAEALAGGGSRFEARLPLARADVAAPEPGQAGDAEADGGEGDGDAEGGALRVLCAEDNPQNQTVMRMILEHFGVGVEMADDGAEALRKLEAERFDAVLMDMQMPVMDGLEATRALRRREAAEGRPRIPVIMVTANVLSEHVAAALAAGADRHLGKPVTPTALHEALVEVLA